MAATAKDHHSFANVSEMQVRHLDLFLDVDFTAQRLSGVVDLRVERRSAAATQLVLDTRDVIVRQAWIVHAATDLRETSFEVGASDAVLGEPLSVAVPSGPVGSTFTVRISYQMRPRVLSVRNSTT